MPFQAYFRRVSGLAAALAACAAVTAGWSSGLAWADDSPSPGGSTPPSNSADVPAGPAKTGVADTPAASGETATSTTSTTATLATPTDTAVRSAPPGVVVGTGGLTEGSSTTTTKPVPDESTKTKPVTSKGLELTAPRPTKTKLAVPAPTITEAEHDGTGTEARAAEGAVHIEPVVIADPVVRVDTASTAQTLTPITPEPINIVTPLMSRVVDALLDRYDAGTTPSAPADSPAAWAMLAAARREFETPVAPQTTTLAVTAAQNSLTYTAPPTLIDQLTVIGLRLVRDVFGLFGIDFAGVAGSLLASENPPFFLTFGLRTQQNEFEVSPGNVWTVWEFEPLEPSGKTVVAIHGGGFILQPNLLNWIDYTQMARDTGATVVVPLYPLSTTKAGSAINVIPAVADFISHEIVRHGAENVSIHADSAGYTYAVGAVRELILRGDAVPSSMVLLSGAADASLTNPDARTINDPFFNTNSLGFWTTNSHVYDGIDTTDPMVSPLYMETEVLKKLPPTTIYVGSDEMLLPDNLLLHQRAVDEGAPISIVVGQGQFHDWALTGLPINSAAPTVRYDIYRQLGLYDGGERTLILTAFPAEADAILARTRLDRNSTIVISGQHFYLGTLGGKKVIVAMTGIGMVNATQTTETALDYFTRESGIPVTAVVFAGVAGGSGRTQIGSVAVPARWTSDGGSTWHGVDTGMLTAARVLDVDLLSSDSIGDPACYCGLFAGPPISLGREPELFVGGDGSSDDNNSGTAFPAFPSIPILGDIFGLQPCRAPDFSLLFTGNLFQSLLPWLALGLVSNITGILTGVPPAVDAVDQETAAAQQVADAHGIPFLGIRGMSDGPGDPLNLPGCPFTFVVYKQIAADNAAIVTEAFLQSWTGA